jgi:hypothetical protein
VGKFSRQRPRRNPHGIGQNKHAAHSTTRATVHNSWLHRASRPPSTDQQTRISCYDIAIYQYRIAIPYQQPVASKPANTGTTAQKTPTKKQTKTATIHMVPAAIPDLRRMSFGNTTPLMQKPRDNSTNHDKSANTRTHPQHSHGNSGGGTSTSTWMYGWMEVWMEMDGRMSGGMYGWMDGWMNG